MLRWSQCNDICGVPECLTVRLIQSGENRFGNFVTLIHGLPLKNRVECTNQFRLSSRELISSVPVGYSIMKRLLLAMCLRRPYWVRGEIPANPAITHAIRLSAAADRFNWTTHRSCHVAMYQMVSQFWSDRPDSSAVPAALCSVMVLRAVLPDIQGFQTDLYE